MNSWDTFVISKKILPNILIGKERRTLIWMINKAIKSNSKENIRFKSVRFEDGMIFIDCLNQKSFKFLKKIIYSRKWIRNNLSFIPITTIPRQTYEINLNHQISNINHILRQLMKDNVGFDSSKIKITEHNSNEDMGHFSYILHVSNVNAFYIEKIQRLLKFGKFQVYLNYILN